MNSMHLETFLQDDGELHLSNLPANKGEPVEVILIFGRKSDEEKRKVAKKEFLELAESSKFCSLGPYPTREELHERY